MADDSLVAWVRLLLFGSSQAGLMASFQKTFRKSGNRKFNSFLIPSAHYSPENIDFLYVIVSRTDSRQSKLHEFADRLPLAIKIFFA